MLLLAFTLLDQPDNRSIVMITGLSTGQKYVLCKQGTSKAAIRRQIQSACEKRTEKKKVGKLVASGIAVRSQMAQLFCWCEAEVCVYSCIRMTDRRKLISNRVSIRRTIFATLQMTMTHTKRGLAVVTLNNFFII